MVDAGGEEEVDVDQTPDRGGQLARGAGTCDEMRETRSIQAWVRVYCMLRPPRWTAGKRDGRTATHERSGEGVPRSPLSSMSGAASKRLGRSIARLRFTTGVEERATLCRELRPPGGHFHI